MQRSVIWRSFVAKCISLRNPWELQDDVMADELGRDRVPFEIKADHAVLIDFALHMQSIQLSEPPVGIDDAWQGREQADGGRRCVEDDCHSTGLDEGAPRWSAARRPV